MAECGRIRAVSSHFSNEKSLPNEATEKVQKDMISEFMMGIVSFFSYNKSWK